ncbi:hypothetical protein EW026_g2251 [Hermanssonia centrifuga]|uniref:Fe2OG dioxygenase domain-containing protein n=1 Tax=Hermanssonia centrifuga TaxID=98765 RepID=A0A4S4KNW7_9APHY|nr:hypothetical protein EW026_g2251 [Hermanssonia centrifuga]
MRVATILVTLPVKFRGGDLIVRSPEGMEEKYHTKGTKVGDMEWTAFTGDCDHEIEPIVKGCRVTISYAVHLKSFGPASIQADPLITPSDQFLDLLSPVLNLSRGRRVAFFLSCDYDVNPAEALADSLVPHLKGGDSVLYHALKLYKLQPELRWSAGGYIWPVDQVVDISLAVDDAPISPNMRVSFPSPLGSRQSPSPPMRGIGISSVSDIGESTTDDLRSKVERSGAVLLAGAGITLLSDPAASGAISKARVPFVRSGELEKLVLRPPGGSLIVTGDVEKFIIAVHHLRAPTLFELAL